MALSRSSLNYQIFGNDSSPKLVFLHGIMGQGRNWQSIAKRFADKYQCLIYDQRGHGKSFHPENFNGDDFSKDLEALLDELGWLEPIDLIGHSMGGRVALQFATENPKRLKKLVIVDISPSSSWQSMSAILEKLDYVPTPFESRGQAKAFFENDFIKRYKSKMLSDFFYSNLTEKSTGYDWIFSKPMIRQALELARTKDYWGEFKNLKCPTLYIRGGESQDLNQQDFEKVLANNSMVKGEVVAGAGHWVHAEKPRETIRIIEDFFNIAAMS